MSAVIEAQESFPNFMRLKAELLSVAALYEDPAFQAKYRELFTRQSKADFRPAEISWNRPGQLSKDPCLVSSSGFVGLRVFGGYLTPDWFPTLMTILQERKLLELMIPNLEAQNTFKGKDRTIGQNYNKYCGAFQFRFRRGGVVEDVVIDDRLPTTNNGHLLTAFSGNINEFFPALLEKAYAKFVGGYYNLKRQSYVTALMDFTGGLIETISMRGQELLTATEMEYFYGKLTSLVGDSFVICQVGQDNVTSESSSQFTDIYLINDFNRIPIEPPSGIVEYILSSIVEDEEEFISVVRIRSFNEDDFDNSRINEKRLNEKWDESPMYIKRKYGVTCNDKCENWVPVEELPYFCDRVIIIHFLVRNPILALTKKQEHWKYFFLDSFWRRDGPRGEVDVIGDEFLQNNQYLCIVNNADGCHVKVVLTDTQRYVDNGANRILRDPDTKIGITILEVERNRQYRLHNLHRIRVIPCHIDCNIDRTFMVSTSLDIGRYIIIPWISVGAGRRYTIQLFSSAMNTEFGQLDSNQPVSPLCVMCQIRETMLRTKNTFSSLYERPTIKDVTNNSLRKAFSHEMLTCDDCRSIYPKRANRISVLNIEAINIPKEYKFPILYFVISCEKERYRSRTLAPTKNAQWNENFIFYRNFPQKSNTKLEVFSVGTLGFRSNLMSYTFSEKELRDGGIVHIEMCLSLLKETKSNCRLVVDIKNYLPSEFHLV